MATLAGFKASGRSFVFLTACAVVGAAGLVWGQVASNVGQGARIIPGVNGGQPGHPLRPDQKTELAMKIKQPFTVVGVGDLLQFQPFSKNNDPDIQAVVEILRNADLTIGDLENEILDFDNFGHVGGNLGTKEVADDWANMGIDMVSRANNKQTNMEQVLEDFRQVERVGIVHMGVARTLPEARIARYMQTPKGLVGMIGFNSDGGTTQCCPGGAVTYVTAPQLAQVKAMKESILARRSEVEVPIDMPAPDPEGTVNVFGVTFRLGPAPAGASAAQPTPGGGRGAGGGARGGGAPQMVKNAVDVTLRYGVTVEQMAQLRAIAGDHGTGPDLDAFGSRFRTMDRPGQHSFDMDPQDLKEILTQVRTGKQASDFLASNFHWHQGRYDFQRYSYDNFPADFEIKFAHMAIDNGDDFFVAQGVHTIKGVEIYKGKPIFYGVSNFVFQSGLMPQGKGTLPSQRGMEPAGRGGGFGAAVTEGGSQAGPAGVAPPGGRGGRGGAPQDPDAIVGEHETQGFWQLRANLKALLAYAHYENGQLAEVRIYPLDLGQTPRPSSQVGIPKRPTPEVAKMIMDEVVEYSKPFGTKISIENGVGYIRIPANERQ